MINFTFAALITFSLVSVICALCVLAARSARIHRDKWRQRIRWYIHHGRVVAVRFDLKGRHRMHCLCYRCDNFKPDDKFQCPIAQATFDNCVKHGIVTPVWECPNFQSK